MYNKHCALQRFHELGGGGLRNSIILKNLKYTLKYTSFMTFLHHKNLVLLFILNIKF